LNSVRKPINLQFFAQEKTEKATPKKRADARKKGQVAKSIEIPGALVLLSAFMIFSLFGSYFYNGLHHVFTFVFTQYLLTEVTVENIAPMFLQLAQDALLLVAPIMLGCFLVAVLSLYAQVGPLLTGYSLTPRFSKLSPIRGLKQIFSMRSIVELCKTLLKLSIIGIIVYLTLWGERGTITELAAVPLEHAATYTAQVLFSLGVKVGLGLIALALLDFAYQKYEYEKSLRMSKQEVKDEHKKMEGDPLIKSKIRERQRRMAIRRMMQELPKADVVITNPTHYAVALQYDQDTMDAPKVIAKGQDYLALRIREAAREHGIVIMENKPLARALYDQVEIGETIPPELFQAVAEVLAYVYRIKRKV
jgi:flagellar biosynthetic protein FlhB